MQEDKFREIVRNHVPCVGDVEIELQRFFSHDYTIVQLKGDGVIGYTKHRGHYFIWFVYIDKKLSNAKLVYNTALELSKDMPVLYSGVKDFYKNNSIKLAKDLYQINIGE